MDDKLGNSFLIALNVPVAHRVHASLLCSYMFGINPSVNQSSKTARNTLLPIKQGESKT